MDPISTTAMGAAARTSDPAGAEAAKVAGNLLQRLLGPSADVMGAHWADGLRQHNLQKLLFKTEERARRTGNSGYTKPRLAAAAFDSVQYSEDEILAEYVSGVLASSRSASGGTDDGVPWTALIGRLSSTQLRLHYLLYSIARPVVSPLGNAFYELEDHSVIVPLGDVLDALNPGGDPDEPDFSAAFLGLVREGLFSNNYRYGPREFFEKRENERFGSGQYGQVRKVATEHLPEYALLFETNTQGALLYIWGLGAGAESTDAYLDPGIDLAAIAPEDLPSTRITAVLRTACWREETPAPESVTEAT